MRSYGQVQTSAYFFLSYSNVDSGTFHALCISWVCINNYGQDILKVPNTLLLRKWPCYYRADGSTVELVDAQHFTKHAIHLGTEMKFPLLWVVGCTCCSYSCAVLLGQSVVGQVRGQGSVCLR